MRHALRTCAGALAHLGKVQVPARVVPPAWLKSSLAPALPVVLTSISSPLIPVDFEEFYSENTPTSCPCRLRLPCPLYRLHLLFPHDPLCPPTHHLLLSYP